jgi:hypothetical protein
MSTEKSEPAAVVIVGSGTDPALAQEIADAVGELLGHPVPVEVMPDAPEPSHIEAGYPPLDTEENRALLEQWLKDNQLTLPKP